MANLQIFEITTITENFPKGIDCEDELNQYMDVYKQLNEYINDECKLEVIKSLPEEVKHLLGILLSALHDEFIDYNEKMAEVTKRTLESINDKISNPTHELINKQIELWLDRLNFEKKIYYTIMDELTNKQ